MLSASAVVGEQLAVPPEDTSAVVQVALTVAEVVEGWTSKTYLTVLPSGSLAWVDSAGVVSEAYSVAAPPGAV